MFFDGIFLVEVLFEEFVVTDAFKLLYQIFLLVFVKMLCRGGSAIQVHLAEVGVDEVVLGNFDELFLNP